MALSKKHFIAIARDISEQVTTVDQNGWNIDQQNAAKVALRNLVINLCVTFQSENPNFDGTRFLKACGF